MQIKASLLGRSGGLHLGYVIIFIFMIEVTLWRDGMVKNGLGGWEGCVPRAVVDACAEESLRGKRDL